LQLEAHLSPSVERSVDNMRPSRRRRLVGTPWNFAPTARRFRGRCRGFGRGLAVVLAVCVLGAAAGRASAEDPAYVGWVSLLPAVATPEDPTALDPCRKGDLKCVDKIAREMARRFDKLAPECSHSAVFALTYLRVTQEYARTS
jgi:hypothetical protein